MNPSRLVLSAVLLTLASACAFGKSGTLVAAPDLAHNDKNDRTWKRYKNALGYCLDYPSRWISSDAFDGNGLVIATGLRRYSRPIGAIDFGPAEDQGPEDARLKPVLAGSLQEHWAGLQKFARAERLEVISQRELTVGGFKALYAKNRYYDPLERAMWMEEVVFVDFKGRVYRIELQCPPDQINRFEAVFAHLVTTLSFDCK